MNSIIKNLNKQLLDGEIPKELNFGLQNVNGNIDWDKVRYNSFYRSYEFAQSKFPPGHESIPGFDKVIESCIPKKTPYEEITERSEKVRYNTPELDEHNFISLDKIVENQEELGKEILE